MEPRETQVESIFFAALDQPTPEARAACVAAACAGDDDLQRRVERLLSAQPRIGRFLNDDSPAFAHTVTPQDLADAAGTQIGPYKLLQKIGEGGMGVVYMAEQTEPVERRVALKIIKPGMDTRQVIARFEAERQALAMMDHPNIAKVLDAGATGLVEGRESRIEGQEFLHPSSLIPQPSSRPFFVMELVKGLPITQFCDEQHLTPRERLQLFLPVCQAVQHAHQKGIIHRDLKPSNILVARYDDKAVPKIIDFGVAKAVSQRLTERTMFTQYGQIVGTIEYMSPEQAQFNQLDVDTRSDIYSLGVLLYELLTGETPFDKQRLRSAAFDELLRIIREEEPPRPSTRLSGSETLPSIAANRHTEPKKLTTLVRGELDWIVMKCLEKDRTRRYETANGLALDMQRYLADEPVTACPPSAGYRFRKFARRNKGGLAVAALVLFFLVLLGSGAGWAVRDRAAREASVVRDRSERQARLTAQVDFILDDVERLQHDGNWADALAAATRAESVLSSGEADPAVEQRAQQAVKELEMVRRLEQIWMERAALHDGGFDHAATVDAYARAFREFGVHVETLPTDAALTRLGAHRRIALPLAAALDQWAEARLNVFGRDDSGARSLVALARPLDPDPLRDRLRVSWGEKVTPELQSELQALAESIDVRREAPQTLDWLAISLAEARLDELQERVLRQAQQAHPGDVWLNMHLGTFLRKRKNYDEAIRFYSAAVAARPTFPAAHTNLGNALADRGQTDEAIAQYREAIRLQPGFAVAHANLGKALSDKGLTEEAIVACREAIRHQPDYAPAHINLGSALADQGLTEEAIAAFREAVRLEPDYSKARYNLGRALSDKGLTDEAIAAYREAIRLQPDYAAAHNNLGLALADKGLSEEAIAAYREAIRRQPDYAAAHTNLGIALSKQGMTEEAIAAYREAIRHKPDYATAHIRLGLALSKKGLTDEAIAAYREAIRLQPDFAAAHDHLGTLLCDIKRDYDGAIAAYREAIRLQPEDANAHTNLGNALSAKGLTDEAITAYREAIRLQPEHATVHNNLGVALSAKGLTDEAITAYREAIRIKPDNTNARYNLGHALAKKGLTDEAIATYRETIRLQPEHATAHNGLGALLCDVKGDYVGAIAAFREAIRLQPEFAMAHVNLGNALSRQGLTEEAIASYFKAIEHNSNMASPHNCLAWFHATCPDLKFRNPARAVELGKRAVELSPFEGDFWNTLGVAHYRAAEWQSAIEALQKSMELRAGGNGFDWFFLSMAHWQLGNKVEARKWYDEAVAWTDQNRPADEELRRFRAEAEELLGQMPEEVLTEAAASTQERMD